MPKNAQKINCEACDFKCCKQSNFDKHLTTAKHLKQINWCENDIIISNKMPDKPEKFTCECGKLYQHYSGLWRHKHNCDLKNQLTRRF